MDEEQPPSWILLRIYIYSVISPLCFQTRVHCSSIVCLIKSLGYTETERAKRNKMSSNLHFPLHSPTQ